MKKTVYFIIFAFILVPNQSFALKCKDIANTDAFNTYDLVFLGKVVNITEYKSKNIKGASIGYPTTKIKFEIDRAWKGKNTQVLDMVGFSLKDMWEVPFHENKLYIVYAKKVGSIFIFPVCGVSKQVSMDDKIIETLDNIAKQGVAK